MGIDFFGDLSFDLEGLCGGVASCAFGGLLSGDFNLGGELSIMSIPAA